MIGKDEATVAAAAAIYGAALAAGKPSMHDVLVPKSVDLAEKLVDELQKRGYVAYDGDDGVVHKFIVPPRSAEQK